MDEVKQMRKLVADNTSIFPPIIKQNDFQKILDGLWATKKDMPPPVGTNPSEILKEELLAYVNGPVAKTHAAFESGSVLKDDEYYYFVFQKLSWDGINISQIISTSNEFTILVAESEVDKAFSIINKLKSI